MATKYDKLILQTRKEVEMWKNKKINRVTINGTTIAEDYNFNFIYILLHALPFIMLISVLIANDQWFTIGVVTISTNISNVSAEEFDLSSVLPTIPSFSEIIKKFIKEFIFYSFNILLLIIFGALVLYIIYRTTHRHIKVVNYYGVAKQPNHNSANNKWYITATTRVVTNHLLYQTIHLLTIAIETKHGTGLLTTTENVNIWHFDGKVLHLEVPVNTRHAAEGRKNTENIIIVLPADEINWSDTTSLDLKLLHAKPAIINTSYF